MAIFPGRAANSIQAAIQFDRIAFQRCVVAVAVQTSSIIYLSGGFAVPTFLVLPFVFSPFLVLSAMILFSGKS